MNEREQTVRLWFDMWLQAEDRGITSIFAPDCIYTESWGPEYHSAAQVKHWFEEWNTRGRVLVWDILRFFHAENHTAVEWRFKNQMLDGRVEEFDGFSLIRWTADGKIASLKEFGCNIHIYDPYANGPAPRFRQEGARWF
ncbi:nuclear transport factor 2 family protein [Agathobaculum massiliense]|uniref:nuclear transport factor 2 family protein n=1 Tax=Agathobaculum massiliense TaxID=3014267 RepID=UPI0036F30CC8